MSIPDTVKVNLNQNLWALLLVLSALGAAEYLRLCTLFWFSVVLSALVSISVIVTLSFYTYTYCRKKSSLE